jgi:uncharacterized protein YndB with AHSA1/START domain
MNETELPKVQGKAVIEPIRRSITVNRSIEDAFRVFTERFGEWWPLDQYSIVYDNPELKAETAVIEGREGGRVYERISDGTEANWGRVLAWSPPDRLVLAWSPNPEATVETEIEVRFTSEGPERTRLDLEHRGWERLGDRGQEARVEYANGWPIVLGGYEKLANG